MMPSSRQRLSLSYPFQRNLLHARDKEYEDAWTRLGRVQILGDDDGDDGHSGCVNALSWSSDGHTLVSSGDDTRICLWSLDGQEGYTCHTRINTGHTANVFSAQYLPCSSMIATAAGDRQVRVFDVTRTGALDVQDACIKVLKCHKARVKRIVTQDSPSYFLSVSEDRTVRAHDLRVPHTCIPRSQDTSCPQPLVRLPYTLSALATSPLSPWLFAVAGEMAHAYLFDRRMTGRIEDRWGVPLTVSENDNGIHCVRRFGRASRGSGERKGEAHVTGARMANSNGHELLLSYHADAVYRYSIHDDPANAESSMRQSQSPILPPNTKRRKVRSSDGPQSPSNTQQRATQSSGGLSRLAAPDSPQPHRPLAFEDDVDMPLVSLDDTSSDASESEAGDQNPPMDVEHGHSDESDGSEHSESGDELHLESVLEGIEESSDGDDEYDGESDADIEGAEDQDEGMFGWLSRPVVYPRSRYYGIANIETVKDVNFLGPNDEYVASGSDDGLWFLWTKADSEIRGIWEGDGSVVNCIEAHPSLPLIATSGIDNTVKLFAPDRPDDHQWRSVSRLDEKDRILASNADPGRLRRESQRRRLEELALHLGVGRDRLLTTDCVTQ